jgi:hypothetical protein
VSDGTLLESGLDDKDGMETRGIFSQFNNFIIFICSDGLTFVMGARCAWHAATASEWRSRASLVREKI